MGKQLVATIGARGMSLIATSPHSSDESSDISGPLLLAPTIVMVLPTSAARCYYGGTWWGPVATSPL
jgi:hypothetical protein